MDFLWIHKQRKTWASSFRIHQHMLISISYWKMSVLAGWVWQWVALWTKLIMAAEWTALDSQSMESSSPGSRRLKRTGRKSLHLHSMCSLTSRIKKKKSNLHVEVLDKTERAAWKETPDIPSPYSMVGALRQLPVLCKCNWWLRGCRHGFSWLTHW